MKAMLGLLLLVLASALSAEPIKLDKGAACMKQASVAANGVTHACYFLPRAVGEHDFSSRNERAGWVVTTLGPDCEEIEVVADVDTREVSNEGEALRRLDVICSE